MAVTWRAGAHNFNSSAASLVMNKPTGTVDADLMVVTIEVSNSGIAISAPAGWTALDANTSGPSVASFYKLAASEGSTYTFTWTGTNVCSGALGAWSGAHQTTPINQHSAWHRTTSTTTVTGDSVTTNVDGCMIVFLAGVNTSSTFTGPTSFTQRLTSDPNTGVSFIAELLQAAQGATGNITATASTAGSNTQGSLVAIAPPTAAATSAAAANQRRSGRRRTLQRM